MNTTDKIFVAGHLGLVGSSIVRLLKKLGYNNILISPKSELDLTNQQAVNNWFEVNKPDYVFLAAAKVGGIGANKSYPAELVVPFDGIIASSENFTKVSLLEMYSGLKSKFSILV